MDHAGGKFDGVLNASQQNHLLTTLKHAGQLLSDCEQILASGASGSPFPDYTLDFNERDRAALSVFIASFRKALLSALSRLGMDAPVPRIGALRAIQTNLDYIDMDLEELRPRSMKGYGELGQEASGRLEAVVQELQSEVRAMSGYLRGRESSP